MDMIIYLPFFYAWLCWWLFLWTQDGWFSHVIFVRFYCELSPLSLYPWSSLKPEYEITPLRICFTLVTEANLNFWQCIVQDTKYKFQRVLVQDGDIGRSWTDLHPQTHRIYSNIWKTPFCGEKKKTTFFFSDNYTLGKWKKTTKWIESLRKNLTINPTPGAKTHNPRGAKNWEHLPEERRIQTPCLPFEHLRHTLERQALNTCNSENQQGSLQNPQDCSIKRTALTRHTHSNSPPSRAYFRGSCLWPDLKGRKFTCLY